MADSGSSRAEHLLTLLELGRQARQMESDKALQFLLVNQSIRIAPYQIGALWIENEGVVLQSGVSQIERNSPFILWLSEVGEQLSELEKPAIVEAHMLLATTLSAWVDWLPEHAVWLPITGGKRRAGLILARETAFTELDLLTLPEWVDIWAHSWRLLDAPTVHGEIASLWNKLKERLPNYEELKQDARNIFLGGQYLYQRVRANPKLISEKARHLFLEANQKVTLAIQWLRQQGPKGAYEAALSESKAIWIDKKRRWKWLFWIFILFPVRLSVLAPGELVPANPAIIRVPIDGIVDEFFVSPNNKVTKGQPLLKLDLTSLMSRLQVAQEETQVAAQEYRQGSLQALSDAKSRGMLASQEGKAAEKKIEADYVKELINKATIDSPRDGIAIFDDPTEWIGKPVAAGEKIMVVAAEGEVEIEAWIPVSDALELPKNASVTLYLNAMPFSPVSGHLRYISHEAVLRPDGSYAYRVRASLKAGKLGPRSGLKGTAKVSGEFVPLSYWVLRKPLAVMRQYLGI